jgi:Transposase IS4
MKVNENHLHTLYLLSDAKNFLIARWHGGKDALFVSTIHQGHETIVKTMCSAGNVRTVRPNGARTAPITIPRMVDDFNRWMGGVNKAVQFISHYTPTLRCQRTWMPIFLHCLDIIRVNAYIICKEAGPKKDLNQKDFIAEMIQHLNKTAELVDYQLQRMLFQTLRHHDHQKTIGSRKREDA